MKRPTRQGPGHWHRADGWSPRFGRQGGAGCAGTHRATRLTFLSDPGPVCRVFAVLLQTSVEAIPVPGRERRCGLAGQGGRGHGWGRDHGLPLAKLPTPVHSLGANAQKAWNSGQHVHSRLVLGRSMLPGRPVSGDDSVLAGSSVPRRRCLLMPKRSHSTRQNDGTEVRDCVSDCAWGREGWRAGPDLKDVEVEVSLG